MSNASVSPRCEKRNIYICWLIIFFFFFIEKIGYAAMNAIGPETFHGQHRGTGTGLQYTCNRVAGVVVSPFFFLFFFFSFFFSSFLLCAFFSLSPPSPHTHEWKLMLTFFFFYYLGSYYCVIRKPVDGVSCLYSWCFNDFWWVAWVVVAI